MNRKFGLKFVGRDLGRLLLAHLDQWESSVGRRLPVHRLQVVVRIPVVLHENLEYFLEKDIRRVTRPSIDNQSRAEQQ